MQKQMLVTSALIYANGSVHLGHMVEGIQTDIWVRAQKLQGHDCLYICGSDAHGTPITLSAQKQNTTPEKLVAHYHQEHQTDLATFLVEIDQFHTTHSAENQALVNSIFAALKANGDIATTSVTQAYDPEKNMFLPDRFVKGTCPKCHAQDQYGDHCEACGATYNPVDLIDPQSTLSGATPTEKSSEHYFFCLDHYQSFLEEWLRAGHVSNAVANKLDEWLSEGLSPWDISRDAPYFGFNIPGEDSKYFYVWLDAPIGYMASLQKYCAEHDQTLAHFFAPDSPVELYHFIGKDIINFHALFWPAMLKGAGYRLPTAIYAHGFLTVNGQKMSKSRGTFITAQHFAKHLNPEQMRYYLATKLGSGVEDLDLNFDDYLSRINSDLVGKVVNIASRCAGFIDKHHAGKLAETPHQPELLDHMLAQQDTIITYYNEREYQKAIRAIMALADQVNQYIDQQKPWLLAKDASQLATVQTICSTGINAFRLLVGYLKPILPLMAEQSEAFLQCEPITFINLNALLLNHSIAPFQPLMQRVEQSQIDALLQENTA